MPRYIDADELIQRLEKKKPETGKQRYMDGFNDALLRFRSMIHGAPTVDTVKVIRCKDCGYYRISKEGWGYCIGLPTEPSVFRYPDDFCSKGVQK